MVTATANTERFRQMAETLTEKIEQKRASRLENTGKRQREAKSARIEADHLERIQRALVALADAHDQGRCPAILQGVRTKEAIYGMVKTQVASNGYYDIHDTGEWTDKSETAAELRKLMESTISEDEAAEIAETQRRNKIRDMEARVRLSSIPGFFPTPRPVSDRMFELVSWHAGTTVLDPSAGIGSLLEAARDRQPTAQCYFCECNYSLCEILEAKGFTGIRGNFLEEEPQQVAALVAMNPPFEKHAALKHIRHAYEFVVDGGELVAIAPCSIKHNEAKAYGEFREWLHEVGAHIEDLPSDSFKGKEAFIEAGVSTCLIYIHKGA